MKNRFFLRAGLATFAALLLLLGLRSELPAAARMQAGSVVYAPLVGNNFSHPDLVTVRVSQGSFDSLAQTVQPVRAIQYPGFLWLQLYAGDLDRLRAANVDFILQEGADLLQLSRYQFDPLRGEPELPAGQVTEYDPGEAGFYLVQFFGPTLDEWLERLLALEVALVQYQPNHAYIVRMTPEQAAQAAELPFVRWVGVYHAACRIPPSLVFESGPAESSASAASFLVENVDATLFNDGDLDATLGALKELGAQFVGELQTPGETQLVTIVFALPSESVEAVAQLNSVLWLNYRPPVDEPEDEMSAQIIAGNFNPLAAGYQNWLNIKGVDGTGVTIALVDTGYDTGVDATAHNDVTGRLIPVGVPLDTNGHGTHVGGIMVGNGALGTLDASGFLMGLGVAPNASLVVRTNSGNDADRTRDVVTNGAVASNHSYSLQSGSSGYTARDRAYDMLVRDADQTTLGVLEPLIIVFSAGNCGNAGSLPANCGGSTGPTKEAKNVIAVANSFNQRDGTGNPGVGNINSLAAGSSRGPAQDGRTYPHIAAPGSNIISTRSTAIAIPAPAGTSCAVTLAVGAPAANPTYSMCSGTSMAAPHVTGAVALIVEWWRGFNAGADPSAAMAKALLMNGAVDMATADIPNSNEGWGRVNLDNVIVPPLPTLYFDQATLFGSTGDSWSITVGPVDPTQPLKVSLAWTDAPGPGSGGTTAAWVNDLDLSLAQGGTSFLGNNLVNGWSAAGGIADPRNNAENVFIQNPSGAYEITVTAANIAGDGVPLNGDMTDQDFALVCYNCAPPADLSIAKSDSADPAAAGTQLTYNLQVTNDGPAQADNVTVEDTLPAGVTFVASVPGAPTCSHAGGTVTCDLGSLPNGGTANIAITVDIDADLVFNNGGPLTITNQAEVSSSTPEADPADNTDAEDTLVVAEADLAIVSFEAVDPEPEILIGEEVTLMLRKVITNYGPSAPMDTFLSLTATAPPGSSVVPAAAVQNQLALGLNELREVIEEVTITCGAPGQQTFTFNNEIQPLDPLDSDPNQANNTAEIEVTFECVLPVAINIKPHSFPNSINPENSGVVPVAILTTLAGEYGLPLDFDAASVIVTSVRFGPFDLVWNESGGAFDAHGKGHFEDSYELDEITQDGDLDLILHFPTLDTGIVYGDVEACVKGQWEDEFGMVFKFMGCDTVRTVPPFLP